MRCITGKWFYRVFQCWNGVYTVHEGVGLARWLTDSEFDDYVSKLKRLMVCLKDVAANIHKELGMQRVLQIYCENKDRPGNEFGTTLHPCQSK